MAIVWPMILIFLFTFFTSTSSNPIESTFNVITFGASPDSSTDSTQAFLSAWKAVCSSQGPATLAVPPGRFFLRNVVFGGDSCRNSRTSIRIDGTIVAPADYRALGGVENWISFEHVNGVSLYGGTLDGQGAALWDCKKSRHGNCPTGSRSLVFSGSRNITSLNSKMFHIVIDGSTNISIQDVAVFASYKSPNTDGIHLQSSSFVSIQHSKIGTGDDCISIGPGCSNLWIENISCGPGHGISIGSLGKEANEDGVRNVMVTNVVFTGTENGARIKTFARQSTSFAKDILFQHATMDNVKNPIIIDQNYFSDDESTTKQGSGVEVNDITYQDIHGTSATEVAITLDCSTEKPCTGIRMDDIKLVFKNEPAKASCVNAGGSTSNVMKQIDCL